MNKNVGKAIVAGGIGVFLAGYFVGFYEMKYKVMKTIVESDIRRNENKKEEESK